ncbi:MAG: NAD(P) oxidoreductase [Candidatus Scalindua rubra]|uniref:NAD(P) oxidoreductase n=1 Tax=Candidatus Scalindua rubra TaxID=1872076 RepID=A0A1E3X835_9BACT|nr:MAG: NAD(P) oxidoreductase [Candidatus Scalindua rubra]
MKYNIVQADEAWFKENINCQNACPVNTPASNYIERLQEGDYDGALKLNFMANLFPHILGRVCTHPCESACRRGKIDEPIAICSLKRVAADFANEKFLKRAPILTKTGKRVAIIGAGPSGLAAGNDLALAGHSVTIFEALPMAGGMLSVGIPPYRLPWNKIESAVNWINELGINLKLNSAINGPEEFDKLANEYDAVYIAAGAHRSQGLGIPGEDLKGVLHGIVFMKDLNLGKQEKVPTKVAVVGGGFTAIDCARSSLRLGAREVSIIYRRSLKEMPAGELEVRMAEEEAIKILYLTSPVRVLGDINSNVKAIECVKNKLGEPDASGRRRPEAIPGSEFTLPVDMIITAIGQAPDAGFLTKEIGVEFTRWGTVVLDPENFMTSRKGVFAGGDFVTGPKNVIEVVSDGRKAARAIDQYLSEGKERKIEYSFMDKEPVRRKPYNYEVMPRNEQDSLAMDVRWTIDKEVEIGFSRENAFEEAERCLLCHYNIFIDEKKCVLCGGCIDICPYGCIMMISRDEIEAEGMHDETIPDDWDAVMAINEEKCIRCGLCVKRCPADAIKMRRFSYTENLVPVGS